MKYAIIVPTLNAASDWTLFEPALLANACSEFVLVVDSESTDETANLASAADFKVLRIARKEFNHGATRQLAADFVSDAEILIYLTQDAILADPNAISNLLGAFADPEVAAAFGRQLPRLGATPIEAHARLFNYPQHSSIRTLESRAHLGFKSIFISNSLAAYRREALSAVSGFPKDVIFGEDTVVAARLLLSGRKIAYVAEAQAFHSHNYSWKQEFKRYFDIGVLHSRESWLLKEFGGAGGEGGRFVRSELSYLWPKYWWLIPSALVRTALKLTGYKLGRIESRLSLNWKRRLSMHHHFWN
ncbi:glycosyltransferase family 2 protein [Granulicella sp. L60]|uniref:glycosyltransferase family 2 protein n=1 Tax=Granulicella sp. L60 TaxID=1641866 RepID=UPI00131B37E2|nr:glycosyltransferase family 2 protein [Granulicella sp. L60]